MVEPVYNAGELEQRLQSLGESEVTLTIVDTASGISAATTAAIRHADLCLIPARPSIADIEATASTISIVRAWKKSFAFVLNQTPIRGQRVTSAAASLGNDVALDLADVLAQPFIVMRNDHQDALSGGLAVSEFATSGKSADEIRGLWRWVETRLNGGVSADEQPVTVELVASSGDIVPTMFPHDFVEAPAFAS
jgi:chromosome partitioning protein